MPKESANMEPNQDRSIVPHPSRELAAPSIGANRILGEMVDSSLAVANVVSREAELDALVKEAKRLQEGGAGNEMNPNNVRAFRLFLRAAEDGHPGAKREVAMCFREGFGVGYDAAECDRWLRLAVEGGDAEAQWMYGMFRSGTGAESVAWLRKAAEQGNLDAQINLGEFYSNGERVPLDYCKAYAWLQVAADGAAGNPAITPAGWVQEQAEAVAALLSPAQSAEAEQLYQDFKRKYSTKKIAL